MRFLFLMTFTCFCFVFLAAPEMSPVEKVVQWLLFIEKNVLYPLSFLFAFGLSAHHYKARFGDL